MTKTEKRGRVPRLRFPEFREAGEWEKKSLADVCHRITNGKANAEDHEDDGIYPLYDRSEVVKKSSEYAFDDEAVIIPGEGMRFQPKYHKGKFNLHQRAYALMQHQGNARFVYYTLDRFKDTLAKNAVKSTVLSLRLPIIERFSLAVPDKKEQQKIADCLSSLDDLITLEFQKLNALKTHKKGLMQQLFPAEGETVPRLRFPEFREGGGVGNEEAC
jgi:type I restriction enzyme S subunit